MLVADLLDCVGIAGVDRLGVDDEVHHQLGAERLDQNRFGPAGDRDRVTPARRPAGPRPDTDDQRAVVRVPQRRPAVEHRGGQVQRLRAERQLVAGQPGLVEVHRGRADERRDKDVVRTVVELLRRIDLLKIPALEHRDPVAHGHRFDLVVGDVDRGDAEGLLKPRDLGAHLHPQLGVEVRQRLVHQEGGGLANDRATHRHPLALPAREPPGLAIEMVGQLQATRGVADPLVDLGLRQLHHPQRKADVLVDRHVRVERVGLEHHGDVAVLGIDVVDHAVAYPELAA